MKSILLIGLSHFGKHLLMKLNEMDFDVLCIDTNEKKINDMMPYITDAQIGDSTNESFIKSLGVRNFDICFVSIANDFQSSLETTALLKENGAKRVIALTNRDIHAKFLLKNGADEIIYAEKEMAQRAAIKYCAENVFDYIKLTPQYLIYEASVPSHWLGKCVLDIQVRQSHGINILATKKNGELTLIDPTHHFEKDESILMLGNDSDIKKLLHLPNKELV